MIIRLPWIKPIDTLNLPDDFDEKVRESFSKFTEGTSKEYKFEDQLLYLDNIRRAYIRENDTTEAVNDIIGRSVSYQLREHGELLSMEEILSVEFMEQCYNEGFRPYRDFYEPYSSSQNEKTLKVILRIVQIVANCGDGYKPLGGQDLNGKEYKICRYCSAIVEDGEWKANYCPDCGRRVDWSDEYCSYAVDMLAELKGMEE